MSESSGQEGRSEPAAERILITRSFQLGGLLGEGGMGEVFAADDEALGAGFAVKRLRAEHLRDRLQRRLFENEASITAAIDHPGTVVVHGVGESADGLPFYAMQEVRGESLEDLLVARGSKVSDSFWSDRLLVIYDAVCRTVAHAHARGFVHRDLKPENVLVAEDGTVYVLDWGVAKGPGADDPVAERGLVLGSLGYLAPEQARGDAEVGPQADVFSLGVILYRILTGVAPFRGRTPEESLSRVLHHRPRRVRTLNRWVTKSLAAICEKALESDPYRRYATAGALAEDLRAYGE